MKLSSTFFSEILTSDVALALHGNACNKAYHVLSGKPEADYKPFGPDSVSDVQNNAVAVKAAASASLVLVALRGVSRLEALKAIADWSLTPEEAKIARLLVNAAWYGRSISRGMNRLKEMTHNHCDFDDLTEEEQKKDDAVLKAAAQSMLNTN